MAKGLTYTDALKLLGGSGPLLKAFDNVLGSALLIGTAGGSEAAISLFDAKAEAIRLGQAVGADIRDFVRGNGRYNRNQRLQAAHGVLVVTAFFEAVDICLDAAGLESSGLSRTEQARLVSAAGSEGSWPVSLLRDAIPTPGPATSAEELMRSLHSWFHRTAGVADHHLGLRRAGYLTAGVPALALPRYEENIRRLSEDVPEFALWIRQMADRAAHRGLEALEATLLKVTSHRDPARQRAALALTYRADLGSPILGGDAGDLAMPGLGLGYIDPHFRVKPASSAARPADESWWDVELRADLAAFLAAHLTSPAAADNPMLLLGQPGAGKSTLTKILAARLPATDFLVVRVALREVQAEAEIQDQVEQALRTTIGETVAWPELAGDADGAMPVILLDGFDELLQATGIHQSDYLQRVAAFQRREATLGRPVAVVVTSRIAVADRARVPGDSLVVRLETFDEGQQEHWLRIWTEANASRWTDSRRPLRMETLRRFPALAEQPLLLLMLALYDATGNALQDAGEPFDTGQLYEQLLTEFAAREVHRVHGDQPDPAIPGLIEQELLRLSVVAFAMFHRLRLWVTTGELDADLAGLELPPLRRPTTTFKPAISAGQEMVGRFFFIQRAQAVQDDQTLQTYEFLHATFGEYLVARLVVRALEDAVVLAQARARTLSPGTAEDDDMLQSLLGYTPLCARTTILPFVAGLLRRRDAAAIREWIVDRLRVAVTRPSFTPREYQPVAKRIDYWMATYSFNLMLLAVTCGQPVRASELFVHAKDPAGWLRDTAMQWRAAVPSGMFLDAMLSVQVRRTWTGGGRRDLLLEPAQVPFLDPVDPRWALAISPASIGNESALTEVDPNFTFGAAQAMNISNGFADDAFRHTLDPLLSLYPDLPVTFVRHGPDDYESVGHSWLALLTSSAREAKPAELVRAYERFLTACEIRWSRTAFTLFTRLLAADSPRLPDDAVADLRRRADLIFR